VRGDPEQLKRGGLERARGAWNRAKKSLNLGLFEDAQRHMCEAVLINPKSLALEGLVDLHLSLGSPSGAKRWAEKALEIRSERSTTQLLVGDVESQLGHPDEALAIWTKALGVTPDNTSTLERVARSYLKEASLKLKVGDFAAADRLFRRAAMLAPTDARPPAGLAQIRLSHSERDLARMWANLALQLDPNEPDALVVLGDLTLKAGKRSEAEELYKKALVSSPHNQAARLKLEKLTR
jgi:tetratricopeptide (TPR) repeat protein